MTESLRVVSVFLASPGDLQVERRLANYAVSELNKGIARYFGFIVELKGWEDTISSAGRPQAIINQELLGCELFIGIMWKKWGTPPDTKGQYTSGFEEEFELSSQNFLGNGKPEMALYFKTVSPEFTVDPGDDLKKVLAFQKKVVSEKKILYEMFNEANEFEQCVRKKITHYLIRLKESDALSEEAELGQPKPAINSDSKTSKTEEQDSGKTGPFSDEGHEFLKKLVNRTATGYEPDSLTSFEIARFRLLSCSISKSGNDETDLGAHDANILYTNRKEKYGSTEIIELIKCGLNNFGNENVPIWHWYSLHLMSSKYAVLPFMTLSDEAGVGALKAMKLLGMELPNGLSTFNREDFVNSWLSDNRASEVKIAALEYLKIFGNPEEIESIKSEFSKANYETTKIALEALVSVQLRHSEEEALNTIFSTQFDSFDSKLLSEVLSASSTLNENTLKMGLTHRNGSVRLSSLKTLRQMECLQVSKIREMSDDSLAEVRNEVVDYLLTNNHPISEKEIKKILVKANKGTGIISLNLSYDYEGQACYKNYLRSNYSIMPKRQLIQAAEEKTIYEKIPYFSLCERFFKEYSNDIRSNVDDQFCKVFEDYIQYAEGAGFSERTIKDTRGLESFLRKELTRSALDVLCKHDDQKDLDRIRKNMRSEYAKSSNAEMLYFRKHGQWEDIEHIMNAEEATKSSEGIFEDKSRWNGLRAKVIYSIARDRLDELVSMEISDGVLADIVRICSISRFSTIHEKNLVNILNRKDENVRKYTSIKCIISFTKSKLKALLDTYTNHEEYRYYNVIVWLDFGINVASPVARRSAKNILSEKNV